MEKKHSKQAWYVGKNQRLNQVSAASLKENTESTRCHNAINKTSLATHSANKTDRLMHPQRIYSRSLKSSDCCKTEPMPKTKKSSKDRLKDIKFAPGFAHIPEDSDMGPNSGERVSKLFTKNLNQSVSRSLQILIRPLITKIP